MLKYCIVFLFTALVATATLADDKKPDPWQPVRFLVGHWKGTVTGESGTGTVERSYEFILHDNFIEERNTSSYAPKEPGGIGEIHHHRSMISYDRKRKTLMLRQFHEESFVNLYALNPTASTPTRLVFDSERFENFDNAWKARETYEVVSNDEFVEIFELAPPGKPYEVYSRNHFQRAR